MSDFLFYAAAIVWLVSTIAFLVLSVLENEKFQDMFLNLWEGLDNSLENDSGYYAEKISSLGLAIIGGIYEKKSGKLSFLKLFAVSLLINFLLIDCLLLLPAIVTIFFMSYFFIIRLSNAYLPLPLNRIDTANPMIKIEYSYPSPA